ncbi:MAG TPA: LacI family DNA-binding transcriptional regulator [Capsulimonadaceae bacterium]
MSPTSNKSAISLDVARKAGVSRATVSYVLNDRPGKSISQETRDRVWSAARDLGYQPNAAARALVSGRTGMIALWMPNAYHRIFSQVTEAVMRRAAADKMQVVISQPSLASDGSGSPIGDFAGPQVDGIFAHHGSVPVEAYIDLNRGKCPIVSTGASYTTRCDCVGVDLYQGSIDGLRHLVSVGCKRIAFATMGWAMHMADSRYRAYTDVCQETGMEPTFVKLESVSRRQARIQISDFLKSNGDVDGLFSWNDEIATAANMAARDAGLSVPTDLAIIGSDGTDEAEFQYPPLTTIAMPIDEMVETGWRYLMNRIENPACSPQQVVLPMTLITRESTSRSPRSKV